MKKFNRFYRATKKNGPLKKVMAKLPEDPNGYSGIFTNLEKKLVDDALRGVSECEESLHPAMFIPLSYIFLTTPARAKAEIDTILNDKETAFDKFYKEFVAGVREWLFLNMELVQELLSFCEGMTLMQADQNGAIQIDNIDITPEIEDMFIFSAKCEQRQRLKRIKILAAIDILRSHLSLQTAIINNDAKSVEYFMFIFMRSTAQFSANIAVERSLKRRQGNSEGGRKTTDRDGLLTLIRKYHEENPTATDEKLWGIIKTDLSQKKFVKPCRGYSVTFYDDFVNPTKLSGELIQRNKKGDKYPIQYKAFTAIRGELRK